MIKISYLYSDISKGGGIERILTSKMNELSKYEDLDITLINTQTLYNQFYKIDSTVNVINLGIDYKKKNLFSEIFFLPINLIEHIKKLNKYFIEYSPDIVVTVSGIESVIIFFTNFKGKKIREIHFSKNYRKLQNQGVGFFKKVKISILNMIDKIVSKKYDKFIVLTLEDQKNWNNNNVEVIYNFKTMESDEKSSLNSKNIISVGRLDKQKGFDLLIDSWKQVHQKYPDWILNIYGEGPERVNLEKKIQEYELEKNIILHGVSKDIKKQYLNSVFYVMSSRHEGLPLVLLEALEFGLPVISFECPCGPKEIVIDNINGYLVPNYSTQQLSEKIIHLIENKDVCKFLSENAGNSIEKFSRNKVMNQWYELFIELIQD